MTPRSEIDISENRLRNRGRVLDILLTSHHYRYTGARLEQRNILWATDSYKKHKPTDIIKREQITGANGKVIQPRAAKSKEEQKYRTKDKAEVFTPLNVVEQMNGAIEQSLGKNLPKDHSWKDYIAFKMLEITCGEAPYITGRYNPTANTGVVISPKSRVGFLDRKLQVVGKNATSKKDWLKYAEIALKSSYGYEWQGDNLLIARENILLTVDDFYHDFCKNKLKLKSKHSLTTEQLEYFAEIISWNIWQMDGLKYVVPMSCIKTEPKKLDVDKNQLSFLADEKPKKKLVECEGCSGGDPLRHTGKYAVIKDWTAGKNGKSIRFVELLEGGSKSDSSPQLGI